jgi:hypothetical protein
VPYNDYPRDVAAAFADFKRKMGGDRGELCQHRGRASQEGVSDEQQVPDRFEYELHYESLCWEEVLKLIGTHKADLDAMLGERRRKRQSGEYHRGYKTGTDTRQTPRVRPHSPG